MKTTSEKVIERICKLLEVKSLVTLAMTGAMLGLLFRVVQPPQEIVTLFGTSYGAIITYFFTRKDTAGGSGGGDGNG